MDERAIETLLAREDIRQQLHNYGRGMDRKDKVLTRAVWHEDGTLDYALPGITTPEQLIAHAWAFHDKCHVLLHRLLQITIEVDGDRAVSEAYCIASLFRELEPGAKMREHFFHARYLDKWSKRDGRWAVDHRQAVADLGGSRDVEARFGPRQGRLDESDPSYALFASLKA
jgi:hypothetical protein